MKYGAGSFNGLHAYGSIGSTSSYGLILSNKGGDPSALASTMTHEEGHGVGMKHDKKGAFILFIYLFTILQYTVAKTWIRKG